MRSKKCFKKKSVQIKLNLTNHLLKTTKTATSSKTAVVTDVSLIHVNVLQPNTLLLQEHSTMKQTTIVLLLIDTTITMNSNQQKNLIKIKMM